MRLDCEKTRKIVGHACSKYVTIGVIISSVISNLEIQLLPHWSRILSSSTVDSNGELSTQQELLLVCRQHAEKMTCRDSVSIHPPIGIT